MKTTYTSPIQITWVDVLRGFRPEEERIYPIENASKIRRAISMRLKYTDPEMQFSTLKINEKFIKVIRVN